jgi:hypothetical protein
MKFERLRSFVYYLAVVLAFLGFTLLFSFEGSSAVKAQGESGFIRHIRTFDQDTVGHLNPVGLAYSPLAEELLVLEAGGPDQSPSPVSDFIRITWAEDKSGSVGIAASINDPINMAFDAKAQRLLFLRSSNSNLFEISVDSQGILLPGTLKPYNSNKLGIRDPQGMAFDPASGELYILDGDGPRLLHITPNDEGDFSDAVVLEVDLNQSGLAGPRGLAFDPNTGNLHLYVPSEQKLYELTQTGLVVATRDMSKFGLTDPQGIVIAPSGDRTDDPTQMSLYLSDSGLVTEQSEQLEAQMNDLQQMSVNQSDGDLVTGQDSGLVAEQSAQLEAQSAEVQASESSSGQIMEFTFAETMAIAAADFTSTLVRTIDANLWNPPSPDTAGITYLPHKDRLLVSDSEVNEMPLYEDVNLFEMSLVGDVLDTGTTLSPSNSNEPTGLAYNELNGDLFISDDNKKEIFIFKAGSDGLYGTSDDTVSSFDTLIFESGDPEGVTFDSSGQGTLYIADGVNEEVYIITPGPNGNFDGVDVDDVLTSFDTSALSLSQEVRDPEGIAFNTDTGNLYLVGNPPTNIVEVTTAGAYVRTIDISDSVADNPAGLAYAPSSTTPNTSDIYIVDRGVDNNSDPNENDGKVYEMTLPPLPLQQPIANDDNAVTSRDKAVTIGVAANDSDADGNLDPSTANSSCTYGSSGCGGAANGSLADNANGSITYTPNPGFTGSDSFVYEICDAGLLCDTATVTITITIPNDPPLAVDDSATTPEDTAVIINVAGNDSDPDGNLDANTANSACTNGSAGCLGASSGSMADNGDGTITYTPNPDFNGSDSFVYEICDTLAVCVTATVNITVDPVNDQPAAMDDNAATVANTVVTIDVTSNDSDADGNLDPATANTSCGGCSTPLNGTLVAAGAGSFNYTPNPGFTGNDSFVYQVCDTGGLCDTASVSVVVGTSTFEVRVSASSDDAEERSTGGVALTSSDLEIVQESTTQTVGLRFNGVNIPQGSIVSKAYIQFQADEANAEVTALTIEGQASDHADTFVAVNSDVSLRPRTSASVAWAPAPWNVGEAGPAQQTTDIAAVIEEIVGRTGWVSGNSLAIIIGGSGKRVAEAYDGVSSAAPLLHVEFASFGDQPPEITINAPADGSTFFAGDSINFSGTASDDKDGNLTASLAWTSDVFGAIGNGGSFSRSDLPEGIHNITATVTDSENQTTVTSATITVFASDTPVLVGAGDIAEDSPGAELTAQLLETIPGTVVTLGDNAYPDGSDADFAAYYEPTWGRHKARTRPATGNHEYNTPLAAGHFNYFGAAAGDPTKGYYSFDVADWHIIVLNTQCSEVGGCETSSPQGQWLRSDLDANPSTCTLAIFHRPLFSSGGGDLEGQDFWTQLYNAGADVVLSGHKHSYERFDPQDPAGVLDLTNGIREFVVGTGGSVLSSLPAASAPNAVTRNDQAHGVLKMTLHPTSYDWEFIPVAGETYTDTGSAACVTSNIPPVANDDSAGTLEDVPVTVDVTANDSDPDGTLDPTTANTTCSGCSEPANGTVISQGNGSFNYTPNPDFNGLDSFVYEVCDTLNACSTATVNISVNPVADPPLVNDDSASTAKNTPATIDVLANDSDPDGDLNPATVNNTCVGCTSPTNGSLVKNLDNTFTYTPNTDYVGPDSFVYEVCDTTPACDMATVNITVTPTNDPPLASDDSAGTNEDAAVNINVAANDSDPDGNLVSTSANSTCANGSSGCNGAANGSLTDGGDGTITYTPNQDFNGADSFVYEICDNLGLCATATVTITVTAVADPPVAADDSANTVENTVVTIDVAANDSDPDNDLDLASTNTGCVGCTGPSSGTLDNTGGGNFSYTPNPGFIGSDNFVYEICDSTGLCDTAAVAITVIPAAPEIFEVRVAAGEDDGEERLSGRISLTSSDLELIFDREDQKVGIRFNGVNVPQGASITNAYIQFQADEAHSDPITLTIEGDDSDNAAPITSVKYNISDPAVRPRTTESVDWAPAAWTTRGEAGPDQRTPNIAAVVQEIVDRPGWVNGNSLAVIITGTSNGTGTDKRVAEAYNGDQAGAPLLHVEYSAVPNDPPVVNDDSSATSEDTMVTIDVAVNDSDINGNLDPTSTNTTCATCSAPANGTLVNNGNGSFNYTPDLDFNGGDSFVYEICDLRNACDTATVIITVNAVNDPPLAGDDTVITSKNTAVFIDADANDNDVDGNLAPVTTNTICDGCSTPANGTVTNNGDGSFSYTPNLDFVGSDSFVYEICDTGSLCSTATVSITVTPTNDPPLALDDNATTDEDAAIPIDVAANDTDIDGNLDPTTADTACAGCVEPANGSLVNNGNGSFTYTPNPDFNGSDSFVYEICDSFNACDTATVNITVTPVNDLPAANDDTATVLQNSEPNNIAVLENDVFGGDGPSTGAITLLGQPGNGTATVNDGTTPNDPTDDSIDYTPKTDYNGPDSFDYQICDATGDCDLATVSVTVSGQQPPNTLYISNSSNADVGSLVFNDEDIVTYDLTTGTWSMYFDGSDVGLSASSQEIDALHVNDDGTILLSLGAADTLPDVGAVDDFDILRFIPTSLGDITAGTYEFYLNGEDVGLAGEDIDALGFDPNGDLVISLRGSYDLGTVKGGDEDMLILDSGGSWQLYVDGSAVGLNDASSEDINGTWIDANGDIFLTVRGAFSVAGLTDDSAVIFTCVPGSLSPITSCTFGPYWDGSLFGLVGENINGFFLGP